ncbi:MAG: BlaI/MecI/CopY family transcriptional regulator [Candidatus Hydrogenedentes bacterium]|nr:BlaI/MecI/CopY family transcriptional regulator [Candidatus Hydrogenedentota bacterium]
MGRIPRISEAEWVVMREIWERAPQTANEVVDAVAAANSWSPRTVKTLLNRLVKKGALKFRQEGRVYHYSPAVSEEACAKGEARSLLQRVYQGALTPMLAHLMDETDLTQEEVQALKRMLEERGA